MRRSEFWNGLIALTPPDSGCGQTNKPQILLSKHLTFYNNKIWLNWEIIRNLKILQFFGPVCSVLIWNGLIALIPPDNGQTIKPQILLSDILTSIIKTFVTTVS